jgi:hypothetical protein
MALVIMLNGHWLYDEKVEMPVDIVGIDRDWWFELSKADGMLEDGEAPMPLGDNGLLYYARFRHAGEVEEPTWVDTHGCATLAQAMAAAQDKVPTPITWLE